MQASLLTARAVTSNPGLATDCLFLKEKAFLSVDRSSRCLIHAHRFLSGPALATVHTCARSPADDVAQQNAVQFEYRSENSNFSSQKIRNESQLQDFLQDRWSAYERPKRATRSSYILYVDEARMRPPKLTLPRFIDRTTSANALNLTRDLTEAMLSSLQTFAHLKDFILLFDRGEESGERELYPPLCVYREFRSKKHGFGTISPSLRRRLALFEVMLLTIAIRVCVCLLTR